MIRVWLCVAALFLTAGCTSSGGVSTDGAASDEPRFGLQTPTDTQAPTKDKQSHSRPPRVASATVLVSASASGIRAGGSLTISGSVRPRAAGHVVYLQHRVGAYRWVSVQHQRLNQLSHFRFVVRPGRAGGYAYRIRDPRVGARVRAAVSALVRVTVSPVPHVTEPPQQSCTPGYSPCIPPAYDVDCAGGSGNGPAYVDGPVEVTGSDPYGLDSDGDGVGCES